MIPPVRPDLDDAATRPVADLPLFPEALASEDGAPAREPAAAVESRATSRPDPVDDSGTIPIERPKRETREAEHPAPLLKRAQAAALDGLALAAVLASLLAGGTLLGAPSDVAAIPYYLPTWLIFSFLYHVVPLMFWGRTPGMAYVGLVTRAAEGGPLSAGQAIGRWLTGMSTILLLGLPGLAALGGASFSDRASRTTTLATT